MRLLTCLAAVTLSACAAAPQAPILPIAPSAQVLGMECKGGKISRVLIGISPGTIPARAILSIEHDVCEDDSI